MTKTSEKTFVQTRTMQFGSFCPALNRFPSPAASVSSHKILRLQAQTRCSSPRNTTPPVTPPCDPAACLSRWPLLCLPCCLSASHSSWAAWESFLWQLTEPRLLTSTKISRPAQVAYSSVYEGLNQVFMGVRLNLFSQGVIDSWYQFQCHFVLELLMAVVLCHFWVGFFFTVLMPENFWGI